MVGVDALLDDGVLLFLHTTEALRCIHHKRGNKVPAPSLMALEGGVGRLVGGLPLFERDGSVHFSLQRDSKCRRLILLPVYLYAKGTIPIV